MSQVIDFGIRISQRITGDDAVGKLQKLESQIGKQTSTIAGMESKLVSAKKALSALMDGGASGKSVNLAAVDKMRASIAQLEADLGKKKSGLGDMLGGLGDAKGAASAQKALEEAAAMAGPISAVVAVVAGLAIALAALTFSLSSFALEAANARRTSMLVMTAIAGSTETAEANAAAIGRVADASALAKGQIAEIGKRLAVAGIDGQRFENTLSTIALATSLLGESAGAKLEGIIEKSKAIGHLQFSDRQLKGLGISFADLAAQVGMTEPAFKAAMKAGQISVEQGVDAINSAITKRFAAGGAGMLLDFNVQVMKLHEHLAGLFKGVNIEPFLIAMHDLLSVFDKNTASGAAMQFVITKVFDSIFAAIAKVEPYAKAFFQGMLIGALLVYIGIVKVKRAIEEAFGGTTLGGIDGITIAMYAGVAVFGLMLGVVTVLTAAVAILAAVMLAPFIPVLVVLAAIYIGMKLAESAWASLTSAFSATALPDLGAPGTSMVDGLVNAVFGGRDRFAAAMKSLGQSGMDALNSIFHFGSPSRAMEQRGEWIDEGGARGVEQGGAMRRAMSGMARPEDARGGGDGKGGNRTAMISIAVGGASKEERKSLLAEMTDALEAAGLTVGFGPDPEHA